MRLSSLGVALLLASGATWGVHGQDRELGAPAPAIVCAWVDDGTARAAYFRDLCRALAVAMRGNGAALDVMGMSASAARTALAEGRVTVAFGMPSELRGGEGVRLGPPVLIGPDGRWGLAHGADANEAAEVAGWVFHALVEAAARGVDAAAVGGLASSGAVGSNGMIFLRYESRLAVQLGLAEDFLRRTVAAVGNQGEIWSRHFGGDPGPNRPVELGGQLYAPPVSDR